MASSTTAPAETTQAVTLDGAPLQGAPKATNDDGMSRAGSPWKERRHLDEVVVGESGVGNLMFALCLPCTLTCSFWTLNPREEALVFNYGTLTAHVTEPGCHFHNCNGREIKSVSVAQISYELAPQNVTDSNGNPIIAACVAPKPPKPPIGLTPGRLTPGPRRAA